MPRTPVLVVGVGSELRSDDAAGRRVVERIGEAGLPVGTVELRSVHQLTPELADEMTGRRLVIVIDASVAVHEVTVCEVPAAPAPGAMTHHLDIGVLTGLAGMLGTPPGSVVSVAVPAHVLAIGMTLSAATTRAVTVAADHVLALCGAGPALTRAR